VVDDCLKARPTLDVVSAGFAQPDEAARVRCIKPLNLTDEVRLHGGAR
jgi:dipeptide transport system ATP-binding protein